MRLSTKVKRFRLGDWGFGLEIGIELEIGDWGSGFGIEDWIGDWDSRLGLGIVIVNLEWD